MNSKAFKSNAKLTTGPIGATLISLSTPMLFGILSMMSFNVIDTFFVGRLGTLPLAALTLTFPVAMIIATFTLGIGVGAMAVISKSIGEGNSLRIRRYATDALTLSTICVIVLTGIGMFTVTPLFRALGATTEMMPYVKQYMFVWYPGMIFYVIPMIGNNILRATGDTVTPSIIMILGMAINAVLDPVFIFGFGSIPPMGIKGAAIASVISRVLTLVSAMWLLYYKEHILTNPWPGLLPLVDSWKKILSIGLTVAVSNAVIPLAMGFITTIVSQFGPQYVAGFGIAGRIENLGFTLIIALSTGISPFTGQNFGAKRLDRVSQGLVFASKFSLAWSIILVLVFFLFGTQIVSLFTTDPGVSSVARMYLLCIPISLGFRGIHQIIWTALNVLGRPKDSLILECILAFGLWIPFSLLGAHIAQISGIFLGISASNIVAGIIAMIWCKRVVKKLDTAFPSPHN